MDTAADNKERLARAFESWNACKGTDTSCWHAILDDDIAFSSLADGAHGIDFSASRKGRAEVAAYFESLTGTLTMDSFEVADFIAEGDRVVGIGRCAWTGKVSGASFVTPYVIIARFRDGKMVEGQEYYDTAAIAAVAQAA